MNVKNTFILLFLFSSLIAVGQPDEKIIDALFSEWDNPDNPGMAAAILYNGEIAYQKGYGSADLEHNVPITPNTMFQVAGMAKHFTAFAILLLEERGKLSLNDNIKKYVPQLPDWGDKLTLKHILSLSSGLHEYWATKEIAGWQEADVFTHEHALELISRQKNLAFEPGTSFCYINSGLTLLTEVVIKVTGKSLSEFTKESLFEPLGMTNTTFVDDHRTLLTNIAKPYEPHGEGYRKSITNYGNSGPTNLYSSVIDLCKWEMNLANPKVGSKALIEKLNTASKLEDGSIFSSSYGIATVGQQFLHKERGINEVYQTGSLGGYASSIFKFPDQDFAVVVLSNNGMPYSGFLGMQSAYQFLEDDFKEPETVDLNKLNIKTLSNKELEKHSGYYWDDLSGFTRRIYLKDDTLRYDRGGGRESAIVPLSNNTFQMIVDGDDHITINFQKQKGDRRLVLKIGESDPYIMTAYKPVQYSNEQLKEYEGTYYCEELNATYRLKATDGRLLASNLRSRDISMTPIKEDLFHGDYWVFGGIKFGRDENEKISHFKLSIDEVKGLSFQKIEKVSDKNL